MTAAIEIRSVGGLHFVVGLPRWAEYAARGLVFLLAVACAGMLIGILSQRRFVDRGLWWVAVGCLLICLLAVALQIERWSVPITLENLVYLPATAALMVGMRMRVRDGTIGR